MLKARINNIISQMKLITDKTAFLQKQHRQELLDKKLEEVVEEYKKYAELYIVCTKKIGFKLSESGTNMLKELVQTMDCVIKNNKTQEQHIKSAAEKIKKIKSLTKKEWDDFYKNKTVNIKNSLGLLSNVKPEEVRDYIIRLNYAADWNSIDENKLDTLIRTIFASENFIEENLAIEAIEFLNKVSAGKATLKDITPEVLKWIKKEDLENRIFITIK